MPAFRSVYGSMRTRKCNGSNVKKMASEYTPHLERSSRTKSPLQQTFSNQWCAALENTLFLSMTTCSSPSHSQRRNTIRLVGMDAKVLAMPEINSTTTDKLVMVEFSGAAGMRSITPAERCDKSMNSVRNHLPRLHHTSLRPSLNLKEFVSHICGAVPSIPVRDSHRSGDSPATSAWAMPSDIPDSASRPLALAHK